MANIPKPRQPRPRKQRPRRDLPRWQDAESPEGYPKYERGSVVETVALGVDEDHTRVLAQLERRVSDVVSSAMGSVQDRLAVTMDDDPTGSTKRKRLIAADFVLDPEFADSISQQWVKDLLRQVPGPAHVVKQPYAVRIAWGHVHERRQGTERVREWRCNHLHPKFQLQQFFLRALPAEMFALVPEPLRPGTTQEVGQQLCSHLMLADSGAVALAAFPTTEQRNPQLRRAAWEAALNRVCRRVTPFPYEKARDVNPAKYRADDPRGDRTVNVDPDWHVVVGSQEPRRTPLLFVTGGSVRLYRRVWTRPGRRPGSPARTSRATFAAIPVGAAFLDTLESKLRFAVNWWQQPDVLRTFTPLLPEHRTLKATDKVLVVPLAYGRKRTEQRTLPALSHLPVQWARLVHRAYRRGEEREKWFLQLTIGYAAPRPFPPRVLGVHFDLDNAYYWALAEDRGEGQEPIFLAEGQVVGNPILARGLGEKEGLEWDQARGRWVGGKVYAPALRMDTHRVVDDILRLAREKGAGEIPAGLGVERIHWVPKGEGPPDANRRFSAWNYGQLPTFLKYKGPAAGVWVTEISLTKADRKQGDAEQARRLARIAIRRLHERRRRAEERATGESGEE